jgi:hypothetical protein
LEAGDWIGALYVNALSSDEAVTKITDYLRQNAHKWEFEEAPTVVGSIASDFELDWKAIVNRGDRATLDAGEVVTGFGV